MKKLLNTALVAAFIFTSGVESLQAGQTYSEPTTKKCFLLGHCREVTSYKPPRGVFKVCCRRIRKYQVLRNVKIRGGGEISYTEMVVIYRNHYSNGSTHTWTCVVDGSRVDIGK